MWERRTCLRSESISSYVCLIWARRYLCLLKGEKEHSSSSRELKNEGGWETARLSILGKRGKVGGGTKAKEDFAQNRASKIKLGAIRGATEETAHFGALLDFRPSAIQSSLSGSQLAHVLVRRKFSSNGAREIGGCKGVFGLFELATRIRQGVRDT